MSYVQLQDRILMEEGEGSKRWLAHLSQLKDGKLLNDDKTFKTRKEFKIKYFKENNDTWNQNPIQTICTWLRETIWVLGIQYNMYVWLFVQTI